MTWCRVGSSAATAGSLTFNGDTTILTRQQQAGKRHRQRAWPGTRPERSYSQAVNIWLGGPRAVVPGTCESGAEVLLPAGLGSCTGLYVAVRGIGGGGAGAHVHMADSVAGTSIIERCLCRSGECGGAGGSGL